MPKTEILGAIEHEKGNCQTGDDYLRRLYEKSDGDIRTIMIEMGALKQQQAEIAASVDGVEDRQGAGVPHHDQPKSLIG